MEITPRVATCCTGCRVRERPEVQESTSILSDGYRGAKWPGREAEQSHVTVGRRSQSCVSEGVTQSAHLRKETIPGSETWEKVSEGTRSKIVMNLYILYGGPSYGPNRASASKIQFPKYNGRLTSLNTQSTSVPPSQQLFTELPPATRPPEPSQSNHSSRSNC